MSNLCQLDELEQIERVIHESQQLIARLTPRRDCLLTKLDELTRPQIVPVQAKRKIVGPAFEYSGELKHYRNYISMYKGLLRLLWTDFPNDQELMARAMSNCGTTRSYVAKTPCELFPGKSKTWCETHSELLIDGWYIDTNINRERMRRVLRSTIKALGLKLGEEVTVYY